jgi:hypothetical protein
MARQKGLVKYSGTMGGVRHFKIKGLQGDFAGMAGGPTDSQIKNDAAFVRTRENMSEFGGSASCAKTIRVGLAQIIKQYSDSRLTGRLTKIMKEINVQDTGNPRGERSVLVSTNRPMLANVEFNVNTSLAGIFNAPYTLDATVGRDGSTFKILGFDPMSLINAPAGATHFRLMNAITVVSDYVFNGTTGKYEPTDPTLNELSDVQFSGYTDLSAATSTITVTTALAGPPTMTASTSVVNCIGIEFYQQVGSSYYLFASGNAMRIDQVF